MDLHCVFITLKVPCIYKPFFLWCTITVKYTPTVLLLHGYEFLISSLLSLCSTSPKQLHPNAMRMKIFSFFPLSSKETALYALEWLRFSFCLSAFILISPLLLPVVQTEGNCSVHPPKSFVQLIVPSQWGEFPPTGKKMKYNVLKLI